MCVYLPVLLITGNAVQAETLADKKVLVTVKPLADLIVKNTHSVPATIISLNQPVLSSQLAAKVEKIHVDIGDNVKKGEVLIELDCRDYQYARQQARATYLARKAQAAFSEKKYQRNKQLARQSTIPQNTLDQSESEFLSVQADINALEAQLSVAELNVERCKIKAPLSGQITQRQVQQGQLVSANTPLLELLQTTNLQVSAELSSKQSKQIKQVKNFYFNANSKKSAIKLYKVVSLVKENTRLQTVRFHLPKESSWVAGTAGRIIWEDNKPQLPASYLSRRNGKLGVLIVEKDTVKFIELKGAEEGQAADIDLPLDTQIVDNGRLIVSDKQIVKIQ